MIITAAAVQSTITMAAFFSMILNKKLSIIATKSVSQRSWPSTLSNMLSSLSSNHLLETHINAFLIVDTFQPSLILNDTLVKKILHLHLFNGDTSILLRLTRRPRASIRIVPTMLPQLMDLSKIDTTAYTVSF